MRLGNL